MEPKIDNINDDKGKLTFTLSNVNVSIANALRRIIIAEIPTYGFKTVPHNENEVNIYRNTSRLNNEILKQRISCLPIHNIHKLPNHEETHKDLLFELDMKNNSNNIVYVTTQHIKIKNTKTDSYLSDGDRNKIFPPNKQTGDYVLICRLKPKNKELNTAATKHNLEPLAFSVTEMNGMSDNYSYLDMTSEELSAKGNGGTRIIHNFSLLQQNQSIETPNDDYEPNKVNEEELQKFEKQRNQEIPQAIQRM